MQLPNGTLELALSVDEATALGSRTQGWIAIANALTISIKTVRTQVSNIFGELQVADRAQAVIRAREAGLG